MIRIPSVTVETLCPICSHYEKNVVQEKDTIVCKSCNRPFDVYADGTVKPCALWHSKGWVDYTEKSRGLGGPGRPTMKTRDQEPGL
jgi:transcription elongation factor Elf1